MTAPAPLFRDPIFDGAADPTIIWNREEKSWWILYTQRRATAEVSDVAWGHGTDIGIASSKNGQDWLYRGILSGLEFERGRNTFWAPEVLWHDGRYHMFVSYVKGVPSTFSGERHIVHMLSSNLWDWEFHSILRLSSDYVIDACVFRLPGGSWRMWYKDEGHGSFTYAADSPDLLSWTVQGSVITDCPHEGPNVFPWQDAYWMITDHWHGLGVYQSEDCQTWTRRADILSTPGKRVDDSAIGHHADVLVQGKNAYIFYFTHPENTKRSSLQVAQLEFKAGQLICDRDKPFDLDLATGAESQ